jgi:hypothetical protein
MPFPEGPRGPEMGEARHETETTCGHPECALRVRGQPFLPRSESYNCHLGSLVCVFNPHRSQCDQTPASKAAKWLECKLVPFATNWTTEFSVKLGN